MPQIVKTDLPQSVLLQNQRKMLCDITGFHELTDLVDIDITGVFFAIRNARTVFDSTPAALSDGAAILQTAGQAADCGSWISSLSDPFG